MKDYSSWEHYLPGTTGNPEKNGCSKDFLKIRVIFHPSAVIFTGSPA